MTKRHKAQQGWKDRARLHTEMTEAAQDLHHLGVFSDEDLEQVTIKMMRRDKLPKVGPMKPADIVKVRKKAKVSQAVLAASMNVAVSTVSQWERGERHPTGAALKLLSVIENHGISALM